MKLIFLKFSFMLLPFFSSAQHHFGLNNIAESPIENYRPAQDLLNIDMPISRIVYQRNNKNKALIEVRGTSPGRTNSIEARLVARVMGQGTTTKWVKIAKQPSEGPFSGVLKGSGGWYNLEVRAKKGKQVIAESMVERVGIGEVFVVVGHSVAQGGDINIEGATDDRVSTVPIQEKSARNEMYLKTGDPQYLPEPQFVQAASGVAHAPFGHNNYFWSKFGELLVKKENVPVLLYNAGFGGTSLDHWAKSSQHIQFDHSFVRSGIRMPYINLVNTFLKYIPLTGIRALLADHGQNDSGQKNADSIFQNYKTFILEARKDLHYDQLAMVVNRQTPKAAPWVRQAQDRMALEPYCFPGPVYDTLATNDTVDGIHLSASGEEKAAAMWTEALTPDFFEKSKPWLPSWR